MSEITSKIALHCLKACSDNHGEVCEECDIYGHTGCDHCFEDTIEYAISSIEKLEQITEQKTLKIVPTADVAREIGCTTVESAYYWAEPFRKLEEFGYVICKQSEGTRTMIGNFYSTFKPTPEEKAEREAKMQKIFKKAARDKGCSTCKHCVENKDLTYYPSFCTVERSKCLQGLKCDTVLFSVKNCPRYEEENFSEAFH